MAKTIGITQDAIKNSLRKLKRRTLFIVLTPTRVGIGKQKL
jgi:hypothetical protein